MTGLANSPQTATMLVNSILRPLSARVSLLYMAHFTTLLFEVSNDEFEMLPPPLPANHRLDFGMFIETSCATTRCSFTD